MVVDTFEERRRDESPSTMTATRTAIPRVLTLFETGRGQTRRAPFEQ